MYGLFLYSTDYTNNFEDFVCASDSELKLKNYYINLNSKKRFCRPEELLPLENFCYFIKKITVL